MTISGTGLSITPSDTVALPKATHSIYVGVAGDVKVDFCFARNAGAKVTSVDSAGTITGIKLIDSGIGYTSTPTVTVTDSANNSPGSGAVVTATVANGRVSALTISNAGSGYLNLSTIEVTITGGFGGVILKNLAAGIVHPLQVTKVYATSTTATSIVGFY